LEFDLPVRDIGLIIVNSSLNLNQVYGKFFQTAGLKVKAKFRSGREVLTHLASNTKELTDAAVLFDNKLYDSEGKEVLKKLKELAPNLKIILISTSGRELSQNDDEKLFDGVVQKPFTISELVTEIERVSSHIQIKGSRIFQESEEIERLIRDIVANSKTKMCSVRNPTLIGTGPYVKGHTSTYVSAVSKGLKVFIVTEINRDNLATCKELMVNRGIELRHLARVVPNFNVWDEKYVLESIEGSSDLFPKGRVFYSNLESIVSRNQFLFNDLWKIAVPAKERIRELEASPDLSKVTVVANQNDLFKLRLEMVHEAEKSLDICAIPEIVSKFMIPRLLLDHVNSISRGVRNRYLFEIKSSEDIDSAKKLIDAGIEVRHIHNSVAAFGVSDKACISMVNVKDVGENEETRGVYSLHPDYVEQYRSIFEILWKDSISVDERVKEIESTKSKIKEL
jgi:FixJ family two-component response regulator